MGYGGKVEEKRAPLAGEQESVTIVTDQLFKLSDDSKYAEIVFVQANGASVKTRVYDADTEEGQADTNAWIHHVGTKIVSKEEYEAAVAGATNFTDFINRVNQVTGGGYQGKSYRMIFHYNQKGFVTTPRYAPFFEDMTATDGNIKAFLAGGSKSATYVKARFTPPNNPQPDAEHATADAAADDLPF